MLMLTHPFGMSKAAIGKAAIGNVSAIGNVLAPSRNGTVMSGRRPLIKGYFRFCTSLGCGHVFGLLRGNEDPAGPDVVR